MKNSLSTRKMVLTALRAALTVAGSYMRIVLPLDIAVGLVVAGTMFGFYSLIRRGNIGGA